MYYVLNMSSGVVRIYKAIAYDRQMWATCELHWSPAYLPSAKCYKWYTEQDKTDMCLEISFVTQLQQYFA